MASSTKKRTLTAAGITRETLEQTPSRTMQLITGIGLTPSIQSVMARHGYDQTEHQRGWNLLGAAVGRMVDERATDEDVRVAINTCDQWDEVGIRLIRAALTRHPEAREKVLQGLEPVVGVGAVLNVETLLQRLDALRGTPEGEAALCTLAARGIGEAERQSLAEAVKVAKRGTAPEDTQPLTDNDADFEQALLELRDWYTEWAEVARLFIKRRDHLIRMGLAERRSPGSVDDPRSPSDGSGPFITEESSKSLTA